MSVRRVGSAILGRVLALLMAWVWFALGLATWLLLAHQTRIGLVLASTVLFGSLAVLYTHFALWWKRSLAWSGLLGLITAVSLLLLVPLIPSGQPAADSPISHQFVGNGRTFPRWSLVNNIIPEAEQLNLGFRLMPYVDALFTNEQAAVLRPATAAIYAEIEQDPHFSELGSAMGWAYNEPIGRPFDVGHYYLYLPQQAQQDDAPLPAIVFLHGSGGNFLAYSWILAKVAEQEGFIVVAPSFGFGNWLREGGSTAARRALADAQTKANIDPERIYLMGLSNGGLGVSVVGNEAAEEFAGLIFVSPVMATHITDSPAFLEQWRGRPVLIISGETDDRVPAAYVRQRIAHLEAGGVALTSHIYPAQDHFLFFYAEEQLRADLVAWLTAVDGP